VNYEQEKAVAISAVRQAARLCEAVRLEMVPAAIEKSDKSPVTVADFGAQAVICRALGLAFPQDPVVGEEDGADLRQPEMAPVLETVTAQVGRWVEDSTPDQVIDWIDHGNGDVAPRYWTLDPIDGTKGFLRGDQYVVALALLVDHQVQIGVLGCPQLPFQRLSGSPTNNIGSLVIAVRGEDCWATPLETSEHFIKLQVSNTTDPRQARIFGSYEAEHTNQAQIDAFARRLEVNSTPVRMDSQAKYALLAAGQGELMLRMLSSARPDYREKIWDQAAGSIIIQEAGGRVTDLDGKPFDFSTGRTLENNRGVLASNGHLHKPALAALSEVQ